MLSLIIPVFVLGTTTGYLARRMRIGLLSPLSLSVAVILLFFTGLELGSGWLYASLGPVLLLSLIFASISMIFGVVIHAMVEKR